MRGEAIVSVHDVMPETLPRVLRILSLLEEARVPPPTLLVVPGKAWEPHQVKTLRMLSKKGHPLAGHGWVHKAPVRGRTPFHRVHSLLISRDEAEHLSRTREELEVLIRRCHAWFGTVDLPTPELYVPPAWALGALPLGDLATLPFRWYEVLRGFVEATSGRLRGLPLAGFEADTTFRKVSLRIWNGLNERLARALGTPLRISIHPNDLDLLLGGDVEKMVSRPWHFLGEGEVARASFPRGSS